VTQHTRKYMIHMYTGSSGKISHVKRIQTTMKTFDKPVNFVTKVET